MPRQIAGDGLGARIETLRARHRALDEEVRAEYRRPLPDLARLTALKRERLRLKDTLSDYDGALRTIARAQRTTA
ncbi:Protein of unknown function [Rhodovulum sp. ES.010]|uniref:YdcH family protein n=1 Tax=Rhodovulum sp. ES.010 TaxID=1882821 RepID=UPI0009278200|nr:YdcH family protein [Rhodovulum sp. ES.010]SIO45802.1 Protein of unknown function [Rhodovulum sp. ES.010]